MFISSPGSKPDLIIESMIIFIASSLFLRSGANPPSSPTDEDNPESSIIFFKFTYISVDHCIA